METEAGSRRGVATDRFLSRWRPSHGAAHLSLCSVTTWGEGGGIWQTLHRGLGDRNREAACRNEVPYSTYLG